MALTGVCQKKSGVADVKLSLVSKVPTATVRLKAILKLPKLFQFKAAQILTLQMCRYVFTGHFLYQNCVQVINLKLIIILKKR